VRARRWTDRRGWRTSPCSAARDETATARGYLSAQSLSGGRPFFPALDERIERDLVEQRTFGSRMVYLRYRRV
jgi:hypothetical protein